MPAGKKLRHAATINVRAGIGITGIPAPPAIKKLPGPGSKLLAAEPSLTAAPLRGAVDSISAFASSSPPRQQHGEASVAAREPPGGDSPSAAREPPEGGGAPASRPHTQPGAVPQQRQGGPGQRVTVDSYSGDSRLQEGSGGSPADGTYRSALLQGGGGISGRASRLHQGSPLFSPGKLQGAQPALGSPSSPAGTQYSPELRSPGGRPPQSPPRSPLLHSSASVPSLGAKTGSSGWAPQRAGLSVPPPLQAMRRPPTQAGSRSPAHVAQPGGGSLLCKPAALGSSCSPKGLAAVPELLHSPRFMGRQPNPAASRFGPGGHRRLSPGAATLAVPTASGSSREG